jgi:hypothetical protein
MKKEGGSTGPVLTHPAGQSLGVFAETCIGARWDLLTSSVVSRSRKHAPHRLPESWESIDDQPVVVAASWRCRHSALLSRPIRHASAHPRGNGHPAPQAHHYGSTKHSIRPSTVTLAAIEICYNEDARAECTCVDHSYQQSSPIPSNVLRSRFSKSPYFK